VGSLGWTELTLGLFPLACRVWVINFGGSSCDNAPCAEDWGKRSLCGKTTSGNPRRLFDFHYHGC
jgi:hypothetical protein